MNKIVVVFILIFSFSCSSIKLKDRTLRVEYLENIDYTIIKDLHDIDTVKIKGNWTKINFNISDHGIHLAGNDVLINFFAYPKNKQSCFYKKLSDEEIFKCYEADRLHLWENILNQRCTLQQKDNLFSIYLIDNQNTILVGIKAANIYLITLLTSASNNQKENNQILSNLYHNLR